MKHRPSRSESTSSPSLWGWFLRRRGRSGLSAELSRTLVAATEVLVSSQLRPSEVRSVCRLAALKLYELPEAERRQLCGHLEVLERLAPVLARAGTHFSTLSPEGRRRCLDACAQSRWSALSQGHAQLRHLVLMAYMECHDAWPAASFEITLDGAA